MMLLINFLLHIYGYDYLYSILCLCEIHSNANLINETIDTSLRDYYWDEFPKNFNHNSGGLIRQRHKQEQADEIKKVVIEVEQMLTVGYNVENISLVTNATHDIQNVIITEQFSKVLNCQQQHDESRTKRDIFEYNEIGNRVYNVGVLMASHLDSPFDLERCGPAVDLALQAINKEFLRPHNITLRKVQASYPSCSGAKAPGLAADMHFKDDVIAFIGPACAFALEPVARLAAYWNSPIITGMGDQPPSEGELTVTSGILGRIHKWKNESTGMFKDKTKYPTLTRMSYCQCRLKLVFASVFRQFNWKHVALLVDRSDLFSLTVGKNLEYGLRQEGLLSFVRELNGNEQEPYEVYLRDASMYARVVILSVRGTLVRKFMLAAYSLGMTNGEWVFLDVEIFQSTYWSDHDWEMGDEDDARARIAYEALLRVSLLQPSSPKYQGFAESVRDMALLDYNYTFSDGEEVNFFIGAFYDGVYLLGMALNETLSEGEDIRDGITITRRMWSRDFHGITGHVRIDDNGDRDADYSILDLDPINGKFAVVAHYYGLYRNYSEVQGKKIHWPGGREGPPTDVPPCGFLGNSPDCHGNGLFIYNKKISIA